jgi:hypothetical protein
MRNFCGRFHLNILTHFCRLLLVLLFLHWYILLLLRVFGFLYLGLEQLDPLPDPFNVFIALAHLLGDCCRQCLLLH